MRPTGTYMACLITSPPDVREEEGGEGRGMGAEGREMGKEGWGMGAEDWDPPVLVKGEEEEGEVLATSFCKLRKLCLTLHVGWVVRWRLLLEGNHRHRCHHRQQLNTSSPAVAFA